MHQAATGQSAEHEKQLLTQRRKPLLLPDPRITLSAASESAYFDAVIYDIYTLDSAAGLGGRFMAWSIRALLAFSALLVMPFSIATADPIWPVALTPSVIGDFGVTEFNHTHGAVDIAAPKGTGVKAVVAHKIVAVTGTQVYASDGTNLYEYSHITKGHGATGRRPEPFTDADVGKDLAAGEQFAVVLGADFRRGGSFDHVHFEYIPGFGADAQIKNQDGKFKTFSEIIKLADDARVNPLLRLFTQKDPKASVGDDKPEIGPIFWRPRTDQVGGFKEFGNQQDKPDVRKGTFINGFVTVAQQITDDQGGCLPTCDHTIDDKFDPTIKINAITVSAPFQVSYQVQGTGVVAGKDIAERVLVTFDQTYQVHESQQKIVYDRRRDVDPGGSHPPTNHFFNLTSTDGNSPNVANSWYTRAKAGQGQADGTGAPAALNNAEGKFPDGIYDVDGFGFDIGANGSPANKTSITYKTRVNNWEQTAVPTKGDGNSDVKRARDKFEKDGSEVKPSPLRRTFRVNLDTLTGDDIFGVGDNYLEGSIYEWFIFDHRSLWFQDDPLQNFLLTGTTRPADATGFIDDTFLVNALPLYQLHGPGPYDLVFDYDKDRVFSWTLDGVSAFAINAEDVPEPSLLLLLGVSITGVAARRRHLGRLRLSPRPADWGPYLDSGPIASDAFIENVEDLPVQEREP